MKSKAVAAFLIAQLLQITLLFCSLGCLHAQSPVEVVRDGYSPDCDVEIRQSAHLLLVNWPMEGGDYGRLALNLKPDAPLIESIGVAAAGSGVYAPTMREMNPVFFMHVGTRAAPPGRPPELSIWDVFFDKVPNRPTKTHLGQLQKQRVEIRSAGKRATIRVEALNIGPFHGSIEFHIYAGTSLMRMEAVVRTKEDRRAILYEAGLTGTAPGWQRVGWMDTEGLFRRVGVSEHVRGEPRKVRHRLIAVENDRGSIALMPPPHQFFDPRDYSDNLSNTWAGQNYQGLDGFSVGVRQSPTGGGNFLPWFNAPPDVEHRLGMFMVLSRGDALRSFAQALKFTHGDQFVPLPGHVTFTSHYHLAHTVDAMKRKEQGTWSADWQPEFVQRFKGMGVNIVHMGEWHGDGHPKDPGPLRLAEYDAMFSECRRLSGAGFLLLPGEEINDYLGIREPGKHPGHWMSFFPKPVYWIQHTKPRTADQPQFGKVYRVGSREDMMRLMELENGLAWTAHPRIKASSWTPDIFKDEDFFKAPWWLGAAFKHMPGDLSREKLGERCLNLLDDMCNWGVRKHLPGEVDTFKLFNDHEIYGHMNINYLRMDKLPTYDESWQPVLDTLRKGAFFTTTGEILIKQFKAGDAQSGEEVRTRDDGTVEMTVELEWTFPLKFAEVISGDGSKVFRERIDLSDTTAFGRRVLKLSPSLKGRTWVRFEVWDVAANGAYTQPVWMKGSK